MSNGENEMDTLIRERDEALARAEKAGAERDEALAKMDGPMLGSTFDVALRKTQAEARRYREALERIRLIGIVDDGTSARVEQEIARAALADESASDTP